LVELDTDMIKILESRIANRDFDLENTNLQINHIDVLKYEPAFVEYDVIANIPYYITSPILRHFLYETENKPKHMVILMQEDVGNKILGK
jgi:16S rRNA (adenine1518-N6/adenine1519-N6)-dimethyltransferase